MKVSYQITVSGKVQNVGFRYYTVRMAQDYKIDGFVKNEPDGSVYIEAEGGKDAMETFVHRCRRGPQWARVDRCDIQEQQVMNYEGFRVK